MNKEVAVSWSGGLDSTALIYKAVEEGNLVNAFYTRLKNNKEKSRLEEEAIQKMLPLLKRDLGDKFKYTGVNIEIEILEGNNNIVYAQLLPWLISCTYVKSCDEIWLGYVANDDIIGSIKNVKKIWKSLGRLMFKKPKLKFPLASSFKYDIVNYLPDDVIDNLHYCEGIEHEDVKNKEKPCGKCKPCIRRGMEELNSSKLLFAKNSLARLNPTVFTNLDKEWKSKFKDKALKDFR